MADEIKLIKTKPCMMCGKTHEIRVLQKDYDAWKKGELIQRAFPEMPPAQRELLITGICDECFPKETDA